MCWELRGRIGRFCTLFTLGGARFDRGTPGERESANLAGTSDFNLRDELQLAVEDVQDADG